MIDRGYVQRMARYNRWQNENLFGAADGLSEAERQRERGAFFGSIEKTLNHMLWGDQRWMSRFTGAPGPHGRHSGVGVMLPAVGTRLKSERAEFDRRIIGWADAVDDAWLGADQTYYSGATKREWTQAALAPGHAYVQSPDPSPRPGPLHADAAGGKPSDTDLPFMPD